MRSNNEDQVTSPVANLMHSNTHTEHELTSDVLTDDNASTNSDSLDNVSPAEDGIYKSRSGRHWIPHDRYTPSKGLAHIDPGCNFFYSILLGGV